MTRIVKTLYRITLLLHLMLLNPAASCDVSNLESLPTDIKCNHIHKFLDESDLFSLSLVSKAVNAGILLTPYQATIDVETQDQLDELISSKSARHRITHLRLDNTNFINQALCNHEVDYYEEGDDLDLETVYQRGYSRWNDTFLETKAISNLSQLSLLFNLKSLEITSFFPDSVLQDIIFPDNLQSFLLECYYIKNSHILNRIHLPISIRHLTLINLDAQAIEEEILTNNSHFQLKDYRLINPGSQVSEMVANKVTMLDVDSSYFENTDNSNNLINTRNESIQYFNSLLGITPSVPATILDEFSENHQKLRFSSLMMYRNLAELSLGTQLLININADLSQLHYLKTLKLLCNPATDQKILNLVFPASLEQLALSEADFAISLFEQSLNSHEALSVSLKSPLNLHFLKQRGFVASIYFDEQYNSELLKNLSFIDLDNLTALVIEKPVTEAQLDQLSFFQKLKILDINCKNISGSSLESWLIPKSLNELTLSYPHLNNISNDSKFLVNLATIKHISFLKPHSLSAIDLKRYNAQLFIDKILKQVDISELMKFLVNSESSD